MTQGMFAAASGIRNAQTALNVIGNNIANINTVAFKGSNINFSTVFANTVSNGSAPTGSNGGTNPIQTGTGSKIADIQTNFNQGGAQYTGRNTDLMINGNGFFAVDPGDSGTGSISSSYYLTRAGNFSLDSNGSLVTASGNKVRGTSQLSGSSSATLSAVKIPTAFTIVKDLSSTGAIVKTHVADSSVTSGAISAAMSGSASSQSITPVKLQSFSIGNDGAITAIYSNGDRFTLRTNASTVSATDPTAARREIIHLPAEGNTFAGVNLTSSDTGYMDQISGYAVFKDGSSAASLQGMQLQVQTATVTNPAGLLMDGSNNYRVGSNSGTSTFGIPGNENRGNLQAGTLETSNIDLASEFANLIVAQRALEANSRVIRSQSEVLQAIINAA